MLNFGLMAYLTKYRLFALRVVALTRFADFQKFGLFISASATTALLLILSGCATFKDERYAQYLQVVRQGFGSANLDYADVAAVPYATIGFRLSGGSQRMLILATDTHGEELWTSGERIVLLMEGGRLKRTVGLPHDATWSSRSNLPTLASALKRSFATEQHVDLPDLGLYSIQVRCNTVTKRAELVSILRETFQGIRVEEACRCTTIEWSFVNTFWLDSSGIVRRSLQNIHPSGQAIEIETLRQRSHLN